MTKLNKVEISFKQPTSGPRDTKVFQYISAASLSVLDSLPIAVLTLVAVITVHLLWLCRRGEAGAVLNGSAHTSHLQDAIRGQSVKDDFGDGNSSVNM